jgi:hypothetical protein
MSKSILAFALSATVVVVYFACGKRNTPPPYGPKTTLLTVDPGELATAVGPEPIFRFVLRHSQFVGQGDELAELVTQASIRNLATGERVGGLIVVGRNEADGLEVVHSTPDVTTLPSGWLDLAFPADAPALQRLEMYGLEEDGSFLRFATTSEALINNVAHCVGDAGYVQLQWSNVGLPLALTMQVRILKKGTGEVVADLTLPVGEERTTTVNLDPANALLAGQIEVFISASEDQPQPRFATTPPGQHLDLGQLGELEKDVCSTWRGQFSMDLLH